MLKRALSVLTILPKQRLPFCYKPTALSLQIKNYFTQQKGITTSDIQPENIKVQTSSTILGEQELDYFKTNGGISILNKVPGVKAESGELFILKFTCTVCETQSIRSFTKHSYQKGVVMVRCGGCERIHLVADNLGWFQDTPVNVQTMHQGKVRKVQDPLAIAQFLQKVFSDQDGAAEYKKQSVGVNSEKKSE